MSENITSYIKWRGDLTFEERPFCDVDNLVLSELTYLDLNGIIPKAGEEEDITIGEAIDRFRKEKESYTGNGILKKEFADALGGIKAVRRTEAESVDRSCKSGQ